MERFSSVAMLRWIRRSTKAKSRPDGLDAYEVSALVILLSHAGHADAPGFAALSPGDLADQVPMSRAKLYQVIASLTDRGVVTPTEQLVGGTLQKGYMLREVSTTWTKMSTTWTALSTTETNLSTTWTTEALLQGRDVHHVDKNVHHMDKNVHHMDTRINKDARAKWGMGNGKEIRKEEEESARDPDTPDAHGREQLDESEISVEEVHELAQRATERSYVLSAAWRSRYEHVASHWSRSEIVEALTATLRAPRPSWAYARACLERMAKDGPALVVAAPEVPTWDAPPDHFPDCSDAEVLEIAGAALVAAWREHLVDHHHVTRYPDDHPIWPGLIAYQLRELGAVAPPEGARR